MPFNDDRQIADTVIKDDSGNPVGVVLDGTVYRLQGRVKLRNPADTQDLGDITYPLTIEIGDSTSGHIAGVVDVGGEKRLQTQGLVEATIADNPTTLVQQYLTDDGLPTGDPDMVVDGSVTPVPYWFPADATDTIRLSELRIVMVAGSFNWDAQFGKGGGLLTNGILFNAIVNGGDTDDLITVYENTDLLRFSGSGGTNVFAEFASTVDVVAISFIFGGKMLLEAGTSDEVRVTIRDSLLGGARDIRQLRATLYGVVEEA